MKYYFRDAYFWAFILIISVTIYFSIGTYFRWFNLGFMIGPYRFNHWLSWIGFLFFAIHVPSFVSLKRHYKNRIRTLMGIHVLGNLLGFMLMSIHFAHQIGRSAQFYPDLGTGVALYLIMPTLVTTGFFLRFNFLIKYRKSWRFLHTSLVVSLFLIIFIHILHGIQIL